jgi:hypothetical protein
VNSLNLPQQGGQIGRSGWDDVFLTADVLMVWEVTQGGVMWCVVVAEDQGSSDILVVELYIRRTT